LVFRIILEGHDALDATFSPSLFPKSGSVHLRTLFVPSCGQISWPIVPFEERFCALIQFSSLSFVRVPPDHGQLHLVRVGRAPLPLHHMFPSFRFRHKVARHRPLLFFGMLCSESHCSLREVFNLCFLPHLPDVRSAPFFKSSRVTLLLIFPFPPYYLYLFLPFVFLFSGPSSPPPILHCLSMWTLMNTHRPSSPLELPNPGT